MTSHRWMDQHSLNEERIKSIFRFISKIYFLFDFIFFLIRTLRREKICFFRLETVDKVDSHIALECLGGRECRFLKVQDDVLLMHHYRQVFYSNFCLYFIVGKCFFLNLLLCFDISSGFKPPHISMGIAFTSPQFFSFQNCQEEWNRHWKKYLVPVKKIKPMSILCNVYVKVHEQWIKQSKLLISCWVTYSMTSSVNKTL